MIPLNLKEGDDRQLSDGLDYRADNSDPFKIADKNPLFLATHLYFNH